MIVKINIELRDNNSSISYLESLGMTQSDLENIYEKAFETLLDGVVDPRIEYSLTVVVEDN